MRALIDGLEKQLQAFEQLRGVKVKAFGWYSDEPPHPSECPAVNIYPRGKTRERLFIMGADPEYDVNPEIGIICWHQSIKSLRDAFEKCETLAETVQDLLAEINARNTLSAHHFETSIDEFVDFDYEQTCMYAAIIVFKATQTETHS